MHSPRQARSSSSLTLGSPLSSHTRALVLACGCAEYRVSCLFRDTQGTFFSLSNRGKNLIVEVCAHFFLLPRIYKITRIFQRRKLNLFVFFFSTPMNSGSSSRIMSLFSSRTPYCENLFSQCRGTIFNRYKRATALLHQQGVQRELITTSLVVRCISH